MTRRVVVTAVKAIWRNRYRFVLYVWALGLIALSGSLVLDRNHRKVGFEHVSKTRGVAFQQDGPRPASQGQASASVTVGEYYRRGHKKCHSQTGECHCMDGYEGNECESAICPHKCIHGQCLRPGYCTCEEGWKGKSCEEATCKMRCVHGRCQYPNFCRCNTGWYGRKCDKQCANGVFSQKAQQCLCSEGWQGQDCQVALCEKEGCVHGYCTQPDQCSCHIAWGGSNCTEDSIQSLGDDFTTGLTFKSKRWPSLTMHTFGNNRGKLDEAWKAVKKWTSRLDEEWKFGRTRFISALPMNDTLQEKMNHKYKTCVAVGNSGSLLRVKGLGSVIDAHELILRYNDGPTRGYEDYVGKRTTIRLLNRKYADTLIAKYQLKSQPPMPFSGQKSKVKPKRSSNEMTMMWRAESYQHYAVLRRLLPEDRIYMLSPQVSSISLYLSLPFPSVLFS